MAGSPARLLVLVALAGALGVALLLDRAGEEDAAAPAPPPSRPARPAAPAEAEPPPAVAATPAAMPLERLRQTVERPLFTPGRQPPRAPAEAPPPAAPPPPPPPPPPTGQFTLLGIIETGPRRIALLRHSASGAIHRVHAGETVLGWTVQEVQSRAAVIQQRDVRETLLVFVPPPAGQPPR